MAARGNTTYRPGKPLGCSVRGSATSATLDGVIALPFLGFGGAVLLHCLSEDCSDGGGGGNGGAIVALGMMLVAGGLTTASMHYGLRQAERCQRGRFIETLDEQRRDPDWARRQCLAKAKRALVGAKSAAAKTHADSAVQACETRHAWMKKRAAKQRESQRKRREHCDPPLRWDRSTERCVDSSRGRPGYVQGPCIDGAICNDDLFCSSLSRRCVRVLGTARSRQKRATKAHPSRRVRPSSGCGAGKIRSPATRRCVAVRRGHPGHIQGRCLGGMTCGEGLQCSQLTRRCVWMSAREWDRQQRAKKAREEARKNRPPPPTKKQKEAARKRLQKQLTAKHCKSGGSWDFATRRCVAGKRGKPGYIGGRCINGMTCNDGLTCSHLSRRCVKR